MLLALGVITVVSARLAHQDGDHDRARARCSAPSGLDKLTGVPRFTFGNAELAGGLSFTALAIGLFGLSEILINLEKTETDQGDPAEARGPGAALEGPARIRAGRSARGSVIGFIFGIIPGVSHVVSTFVSYAVEKRFSKHPEEFGKGAIAGVAGPETANNAVTGTAMIPLLALGIPSIPATAILLSALTIHGVQPGPLLLTDHPEVFWGLVASMYIGNVDPADSEPAAGRHLREPAAHSLRAGWCPIILVISIIGVYSVNFSTADIWIMVVSGGVGYVLRKFGYEMAPLLLALVLGDRLEENFRLALTMSGGSYATFADRISHRGGDGDAPASCWRSTALACDLRLPQIPRRRGGTHLTCVRGC